MDDKDIWCAAKLMIDQYGVAAADIVFSILPPALGLAQAEAAVAAMQESREDSALCSLQCCRAVSKIDAPDAGERFECRIVG